MNFGIILRWMFSMNIKYISSIQTTWSQQRREKKKTALILNEYNNMAKSNKRKIVLLTHIDHSLNSFLWDDTLFAAAMFFSI